MKILLDEMMPEELGDLLVVHEVRHVIPLGWRHITNGKLLSLGESHGFQVFLTKDGNLPFQQNLANRHISVMVLRPKAQSVPSLLTLAPQILLALEELTPGTVVTVSA